MALHLQAVVRYAAKVIHVDNQPNDMRKGRCTNMMRAHGDTLYIYIYISDARGHAEHLTQLVHVIISVFAQLIVSF